MNDAEIDICSSNHTSDNKIANAAEAIKYHCNNKTI